MTRVRTFLLIDLAIFGAFIVSAVSGLVFFIPARFMDFATASVTPTFLGVNYRVWVDVHTYSGLVMIVGLVVHVSLHWHWMMRTAGGMLPWSSRRRGAVRDDAQSLAAQRSES